MDKTNAQSGQKLVSGISGIGVESLLQKSKKLRRLSSVNVPAGPSNEVDSSDGGVNECPSPFSAPTKFSDGLNAVDHACIPRKLRSAMKKPNLRSLSKHSPKSKKRNRALDSVEPCKKDDIKKHEILKLEQAITELPEKPTASGPISKDEEDAVQSLFALAGMSRDDDENVNAIEDGVTSNSHSQAAAENESLSNVDNTNDESAKLTASYRTAYLEHRDFFERKLKHTELDSLGPCIIPNHTTPSSAEDSDEKPLFLESLMSPEFSLDLRLKQSGQQLTPPISDLAISQEVTAKESYSAVQPLEEPGKNEGLTLWRDLFSKAKITSGSQSPSQYPSQVAAAKLPALIALVQPTISSSSQSSPRTSSSKLVCERWPSDAYCDDQISEVAIAKKAVKRSMAHVCISHFIQTLKKQEDKANMPSEAIEWSQHKELKGGALPNCKRVKPDGMNITIAANKSLNFAANGKPRHSFDFLSLSTGDGSSEGNTVGKGPESSSQLQVPYLQALPIQSILPFSMPQTRHQPFTYAHQISATASQVERQLPQSLNAELSQTFHISQSGLSKQEQELWAIQLSAKHRAIRTSTAQRQFPKRQLRQQVSPTVKLSLSAFPTSSLDSILPMHS